MAGTFSQIYLHAIFAVKHRQKLLNKNWQNEVFAYMKGIIEKKNQKCYIVNGNEDHVHIFFGIRPGICISDLIRDVKNNSSKYINDRGLSNFKFEWQEGYGVFSYSKSHFDQVYTYVLNQEKHHQNQTFKEEYIDLLKIFDVDYDEKYVFD